jgi:glycosyltransferase involved in cell wall biosynthesis
MDALETWKAVAASLPGARLVVVGVGPERERTERRARDLGVSDLVTWRGFVTEEEKHDLLASARLFLAPSYEEGWGIAIAEALASGLPVVAYRLPTLDEVFGDGYCGVPVGDTRALAEAVLRLLRDDRLTRRLSAVGRDVVQRYDLGRVAQVELETILRGLRAAGSPSR